MIKEESPVQIFRTETQEEFVGVVIHELRNPLTALKIATQMLLSASKRGGEPALSENQTKMIVIIDHLASRLAELADDLLDVAQLQAGELTLQFEPCDLVTLLHTVMERLQMTTGKHILSIESPFPSLLVSLDRRRMEQVFINVIGNAIKYSPEESTVEIALREVQETQEVMISIRDHGIGIPQQEQARIFERFARATNTNTHKITGTGLGLYLSREIVERHAGHIWFDSAEGQGSTFFITLPLHS